MSPSEPAPVRLRGSKYGLFSRSALFLCPDHLLAVRHYGYVERYQRFPYRNIQALVIQRTRNGRLLHVALAAVTLAWLGLAVLMHRLYIPPGAIFFTGLAGVTVLMTFFHAAMGPTCRCHVQTAVQTAEMPSLRRLRHARAALAALAPQIAEVQGSLPEDFPAAVRPQAVSPSGPRRPPPLPEAAHAG